MRLRAKRVVARIVRWAILRYVRAAAPAGSSRDKVIILLISGWGMGGTVRAGHNLAGYLAKRYDVLIVSVYRRHDLPFFGRFPPGVRAVALDDQRPEATPRIVRPLRKLLKSRSSLFYHPADHHAEKFSVWTDLRLAAILRRQKGFLIGTRPGLNMLAVELGVPGLLTIGEDQMNLGTHRPAVHAAMAKRYHKLDALALLTDADMQAYAELLDGRAPRRLIRIPNTVRPMSVRADMAAKTVLAAGRLHPQKGFEMLIGAFAQVAPDHPDWNLRICGRGRLKDQLTGQIERSGLTDAITLAGPARELGDEMERASIFAMSSRFEGFPLVLLEAMYAGMAAVSFDCPTGPRDVIDDHRNGLLVPAEDVDGLAAAIREMIEDEELRRRCGAAAVETASRYTMAAIGPKWEALLAELAADREHRIA